MSRIYPSPGRIATGTQAPRHASHRRRLLSGFLILVSVAALIAACGGTTPEAATQPPEVAAAAVPTPTAVSAPTEAPEPTSTPTAIAAATASPTPTTSPEPTAAPTPTGPRVEAPIRATDGGRLQIGPEDAPQIVVEIPPNALAEDTTISIQELSLGDLPDGVAAYGLPIAYQDRGGVRVLRAQRAVFQQWMIPTTFTTVGGVVVSNGGDHYKVAGQIPPSATVPRLAQPLQPTGGSAVERRTVHTARGSFTATIVRIDLGDPALRVMTLFAPPETGRALLDYVTAVDGFAGMNGTYFCPPNYAFCPNDPPYFTNSRVFDSRLGRFDRSFADPAFNYVLTFDASNTVRLEPVSAWGDVMSAFAVEFEQRHGSRLVAAIASHPQLVKDGRVNVQGRVDERQRTEKMMRGGIGIRGRDLYLLQVANATVDDLAEVMVALGMDVALNLDSSGSAALVSDGAYVIGPGRLIPNAIVFVKS